MAFSDSIKGLLGVSDEPIVTSIPADLRPRILDYTALHQGPQSTIKPILHQAQHFALGLTASQDFLRYSTAPYADLIEELRQFAPHPFESYTLSFWMGNEDGRMIECLIIVGPRSVDRVATATIVTMTWGEDAPNETGAELITREQAQLAEVGGEFQLSLRRGEVAWKFVDVFRVLLSQPGVIVVNKGGSRHTGLHKGKRVTYYTASQITIDLDKMREQAATPVHHTGYGRMMPNYGYRAHNCHSGGLRHGCDHFWIEIGGRMDENEVWHPDPQFPRWNATWECYHCGRRRWHRKEGRRGDSSIGYVKQKYKIVRGENDIIPS